LRRAICPGSFDPITKGHLDIIKRTARIYDELIVAVVHNPNKSGMFSLQERIDMIDHSIEGLDNVVVDSFVGLLTDYVIDKDVNIIVKGLRAVSDFEYEFQMALMNKVIAPEVETLFMMTSSEYSFLSSSMVKEVARLGGDISSFVSDYVGQCIENKLTEVED
jgi:pantetheine-phosphate adenylyltransferase